MNKFISKYQAQLSGTLSGFDRLVLRGNLGLNHEQGMKGYLWANGLGLKDFGDHAQGVSQRVKQAALAGMEAAGRPVRYLNSGQESKEQIARAIVAADGIHTGPVCALTAVELCASYTVRGDREQKKLKLERSWRKCLFVYQYWVHPLFGFLSMRLQTWFPFTLCIYLNGREWLARQMDQVGLAYERQDNCFVWMEDFARAQLLMNRQLQTHWPEPLEEMVQQAHPLLTELSATYPLSYYWTCWQSEWATDYVFRDPAQLRHLYPQLVHLGMTAFSSPDILRFMGRKVTAHGSACGRALPVLTSDLKLRSEGVRIKHRLGANSIKLYDKAYSDRGAVLRAEVTVNAPEMFRVYRSKSEDPDGPMGWRTMRRGLADLYRRAEVSQNAVDRYSSALASVDDTTTLAELTARIEQRVRWNGSPVRALHPFEPGDHALLEAVNRGEFSIHGLRNRDLQRLLYHTPASSKIEARRRSAAVSRKLRLLRAHGLLQKLAHTHRYQVTELGRLTINAITAARRTTVQRLTDFAA